MPPNTVSAIPRGTSHAAICSTAAAAAAAVLGHAAARQVLLLLLLFWVLSPAFCAAAVAADIAKSQFITTSVSVY
jgi:phosphate/sulfate permease